MTDRYEPRYSIAGYLAWVINSETGETVATFPAELHPDHGTPTDSAERAARALADRLNSGANTNG